MATFRRSSRVARRRETGLAAETGMLRNSVGKGRHRERGAFEFIRSAPQAPHGGPARLSRRPAAQAGLTTGDTKSARCGKAALPRAWMVPGRHQRPTAQGGVMYPMIAAALATEHLNQMRAEAAQARRARGARRARRGRTAQSSEPAAAARRLRPVRSAIYPYQQ